VDTFCEDIQFAQDDEADRPFVEMIGVDLFFCYRFHNRLFFAMSLFTFVRALVLLWSL
jgi:hypothetical protein